MRCSVCLLSDLVSVFYFNMYTVLEEYKDISVYLYNAQKKDDLTKLDVSLLFRYLCIQVLSSQVLYIF